MEEITCEGVLYVVGTPIGNLADVTLRSLDTLRGVDLIIAEDTRRTLKLLSHFEISKPIESFNERNSVRKIDKIVELLKTGKKVALVSDAGMPVISDPGANLVKKCHLEGIKVAIVPGPSALTSAVALSGFGGNKFYFIGFMPKDKNRRRLLRKLAEDELIERIVFFESPERLRKTLEDISNILGNKEIFIARELTKIHEELFYGTVSQALEHFKEVRGELTIVLNLKDIGKSDNKGANGEKYAED
ncbi:MAG TPA: 16S rRNA (cytidine(1402)-2'-O)-methyltransferase [Fervidobacterium sp.]|nr:16S rRNA (cytidine(1402)-2'-O)-methyltransferase [Fervidobacterium sp.]HOM74619.1 16S rRNA (cytidine(1402)-2'-O)-methyltransferase [Fervidobacterium sp.]HOQ40396.1 16S rRNA (cytidine(1402)-2'-O)-methyltransferase [Fervidobacterium sp.]HPT54907.1 16S rRNA (cytidine(1402)-2'-O)-methyltransferase [Fervidobacterium sp.]HPZ18416.1 16S rRNA (cytidine(1402)-2'-O)-methyltransferase [Fervidobacterium sp.]